MAIFHPESILNVLQENLNPEFFLLNLQPGKSSRAHTGDLTYNIVSWAQVIITIIIIIVLWRLFR